MKKSRFSEEQVYASTRQCSLAAVSTVQRHARVAICNHLPGSEVVDSLDEVLPAKPHMHLPHHLAHVLRAIPRRN
jgi:hypothetical protein